MTIGLATAALDVRNVSAGTMVRSSDGPPRCLQPAEAPPSQALAEARVALRSAFEARMARSTAGWPSGGLPWKPYDGRSTGRASAVDGTGLAAIARATALVQHAVEDGSEAQSELEGRQLRALLRLVAGDFEGALAVLEALHESCPTSAEILNDLAVAYLERFASRAAHPLDAIQALDAALSSLALAPSREAAFNRALADERLGLGAAAAKAWAAVGGTDGWAVEAESARARTAAALEHVGSPASAAARPTAPPRDRLLTVWSTAVLAGDKRAVATALEAFQTLVAQAGPDHDALDADLEHQIEVADEAQSRRLARGSAALERSRACYAAASFPCARQAALEALAELPNDAPSFEDLAALQAGRAEYMSGQLDAARRRLESLAVSAGGHGFRDIHGKALWLLGLIESLEKSPLAALERFSAARVDFTTNRDVESVAAIETMLGDAWEELGEQERAWEHRALSLSLSGQTPRRAVALVAAGEDVLESWPRAAEELADEAEFVGARQGPAGIGDAIAQIRVRARMQLGDTARALKILRGRSPVGTVESTDAFGLERVLIDLLTARVMAGADPVSALRLLDGADRRLKANARALFGDDVLLDRSRIETALGRYGDAEKDLWRLLQRDDRVSLDAAEFALRPAREAVVPAALDELLDLLARRAATPAEGLVAAAMASEKLRRVRTVNDSRTAPVRDIAGAQRLAAALEPGQALVVWMPLADRCVRWVVTRHGVEQTTIRRDRRSLARAVDSFAAALAAGGLAGESFPELEDLLAGSASVRDARELLTVPNDVLAALPIAALPLGGVPVVLGKTVVVLPAIEWVRAGLSEGTASAPLARAIFVAPSVAADFADLAGLPGTKGEWLALHAAAPSAQRLEGPQATAAAFRGLGVGATWIHFAGHAVKAASRDAGASLLFAPARPGDLGILPPKEFLHMGLVARGVVLAACTTRAGDLQPGGGVLSLPYYLLAGGVREVIATLWPVDDRATEVFFERFYRHLAAGQSVRSALAATQRESREDGDPSIASTRTWAAFQLVG